MNEPHGFGSSPVTSTPSLSITDFAKLHSISESTVRRLIRGRRIAAFQPGGPGTCWRIPANAFEAGLDQKSEPATPISEPYRRRHRPPGWQLDH